ncbi:MAG: type II toxin-antitoxin system YafQ family toxin [Candidatus Adiutrix sp.]|jgi:mRNA interferase YafQ|nr:type II toxin-antitoxin system YafQ family toxin [Candidatus Adiutrix sp.]
MLETVRSRRFDKDVELARKRGYNLDKLKNILWFLVDEQPLPPHCHDHQLKGDWKGFRDAHIETDWLLIYAIKAGELHLARTGSHADIFG